MTGINFQSGLHILLLSSGAGLPLLFVLFLWWRPCRKTVYALLPLTTLPALLIVLFVPSEVVVEVPWFFMGGRMGIDPIGRAFLFFTALVWCFSTLFGQASLSDDPNRYRFFGYFLVAMAGNFGLILAQDGLGFYLFFAMMSFAAYGLIIHDDTPEALRAGRIYLGLVIIGEVLLFAALLMIAGMAPGLLFSTGQPGTGGALLFVLLFLGFGIKAGALPVHFWLPLAHPVAPTAASAVLSGAMIKAGLLGWLRFYPLGLSNPGDYGEIVIVLGLIAAFYGVVVGLGQREAKTVLAYSSISQMGLMTILTGCAMLTPTYRATIFSVIALYAIHHGLAKSTLFLGTGLLKSSKNQYSQRCWLTAGLIFIALTLAGFPFTSGAMVKTALKNVSGSLAPPWSGILHLLLPLTAVATMVLMVHFFTVMPTGKASSSKRKQWREMLAWGAGLLGVVAGLRLWPEAARFHYGILDSAVLWNGLWPILMGSVIGWLIHRMALRAEKESIFELPPGDIVGVEGYWNQRKIIPWFTSIQQTPPGDTQIFGTPGFISFFSKYQGELGKREKILMRWKVIGILYLTLCLCLIVLFAFY
ncbi:MAG: complex I subunit 5 family protein [Proteobacteria bacterium]|nr:complex I subunit 5 family protein [Pseudomonadota bacterium]MBU1686928.1 complex I subunit 5 family protein [Pseudomonadota bacterium]